jgi:hypothetical protein
MVPLSPASRTTRTVTVLGGWTRSGGYVYVETRDALEGIVSGLVFETRRLSRIDSYAGEPGAAAAASLPRPGGGATSAR